MALAGSDTLRAAIGDWQVCHTIRLRRFECLNENRPPSREEDRGERFVQDNTGSKRTVHNQLLWTGPIGPRALELARGARSCGTPEVNLS